MLARHLLFLATRRPNKALLAIQPSEPVSSTSSSACPLQHQQQPPPYVGPPQVQAIHEDYPYRAMYEDQTRQLGLPNNRMHPNFPTAANQHQNHNYHHHHHHHCQQIYQHQQPNVQRILYEKNNLQRHHCQQPYPDYTDNNHTCNNKTYAHRLQNPVQGCDKTHQQFYTLPNRRPNREVAVEPPRSITPDITRGLARGPLGSAMHMLAKQGRKSDSAEKLLPQHQSQTDVLRDCRLDLDARNLDQFEARCKLAAQEQQRNVPVDVKNRFASPLGLSALGYRFFASPIQENLKTAPLSPIGPERANGFESSTPTNGRATPTVAERLALQSQRCVSPNPALLRHASSEKQLVSSPPCDSGRSTPTGLLLSPIKSTMSNEELFAAIHKSKKRLNIRDDPESLSPAGSLSSLAKGQQTIGTRHSWSPESQKTPEIPKTVLLPSATSRMDFKRLLLQQSIKAGPTRISAAEQLKLSRQQCQESQQHPQQYQQQQQQQQQYHHHHHHHQQQQQYSPVLSKFGQQTALTKVLSPRSAWRFQTPRTDVLSSTIIEDAAAEEKAMKPSPENNPLPAPRIPTTLARRQLDISETQRATTTLDKRDKEIENRLQAADTGRSPSSPSSPSSPLSPSPLSPSPSPSSPSSPPPSPLSAPPSPPSSTSPIKAIESRRMSNQLARAQFLAGSASPAVTANNKDLFGKRFRARSESPRQNGQRTLPGIVTQLPAAVVTRSPSAPTLETAL